MNTDADTVVTLMDFSEPASTSHWYAINDGVMGGESQGGPQVQAGELVFTGVISLDNNGGFSSVKSSGHQFDLRAFSELKLRVKGDGRRYQLRLYTGATYGHSPIAYVAEFATQAGQWIEPVVALAQLTPRFRGRTLSGPAFDASCVQDIGFLLADKQEGEFELRVSWIKAK